MMLCRQRYQLLLPALLLFLLQMELGLTASVARLVHLHGGQAHILAAQAACSLRLEKVRMTIERSEG